VGNEYKTKQTAILFAFLRIDRSNIKKHILVICHKAIKTQSTDSQNNIFTSMCLSVTK